VLPLRPSDPQLFREIVTVLFWVVLGVLGTIGFFALVPQRPVESIFGFALGSLGSTLLNARPWWKQMRSSQTPAVALLVAVLEAGAAVLLVTIYLHHFDEALVLTPRSELEIAICSLLFGAFTTSAIGQIRLTARLLN
jgi:hypothetical protein